MLRAFIVLEIRNRDIREGLIETGGGWCNKSAGEQWRKMFASFRITLRVPIFLEGSFEPINRRYLFNDRKDLQQLPLEG